MTYSHAVVCWGCGYTQAASSKDTLWALRNSHECNGRDVDIVDRSEVSV